MSTGTVCLDVRQEACYTEYRHGQCSNPLEGISLLWAKLGVEGTLEPADVNLAHGQELRLIRNYAPKGMASLIARILTNVRSSQEWSL